MVADLLHEALRMGDERGVRVVRRVHLHEDDFVELANLVHAHALTVGREGNSYGERIFTGILSWWQNVGSLSEEETGRLFKLRTDVCKWLALGQCRHSALPCPW